MTTEYKNFYAPKDKKQLELWKKFLVEEVQLTREEAEHDPISADKNWEFEWIKYRDKWLGFREPETFVKEESEEETTMATESKGKSTDEKVQKALQKAVKDPGSFNGSRERFDQWWNAMTMYLKAYESSGDIVKMQIVLSRMNQGEPAMWARNRISEVNAGTLISSEELNKQVKE